MASTSSSTAVTAITQRASNQYLECRRSVTAKVDEVKLLDEQIAAVFQQISALSEDREGLSDEDKAAAKSVGRLEVSLLGVEGDEPVPDAKITVTLDPEYEADEFETVEEVVEKKDVVVTDEHGHVVDDQAIEENGEHTPRKLKTTTKITRTIIKKRVKIEKEPVVRTIAWNAASKSENGDELTALTFPASFIFDPVQSREAIVIITVAAASSEDEEEPDVAKEIEIPISSLFHDNVLDKWYTITDEDEEDEPTTITEVVEEVLQRVIEKEASFENKESSNAEKVEEAGKDEISEEDGGFKESKIPNEAEDNEAFGIKTTEQAEKAEDEVEEEGVEAAEEVEEDGKDDGGVKHDRIEVTKPICSRFHVKASFALSEAEKLSISVVALSKKKQEAEATLLILEREASSLRIKYDRLNASQRQMNAAGLSKPKSSLLASRFGAGSVPVQPKSLFQSLYESVTGFGTKHQQLLVSVAMFTGSVCLFHFNGENLLA